MKEFQGTIAALLLLALLAIAWSSQQKDVFEESALVCAVNPAELERLTIKNEHGFFTIRRNKVGNWIVEVPKSSEAEWSTEVKARDNLFQSISRLQADRWMKVTPQGEDLGFTEPTITAEMEEKGGTKTRLVFGKTSKDAGSIYAKKEGDDRIFSIAEARIIPLRASPMALRDRRVATVPFERVTKITLRNHGGGMVFTRQGEGIFSLSNGEQMRAFPPRVRSLTDEVSNLRADGFSDMADRDLSYFGFDKPNISLDIELMPPLEPIHLEIGKRHPDSSSVVYLRNKKRAVVYHIRAEQLVTLMASKDEFRDRTPFTLPGEPFDFIEVYDYRDKTAIKRAALTKKYSRWDLHSFKKDIKNIGDSLLPNLAKIRATSYRRIPTENLANLGMHEPLFRVSLTAGNDPLKWFKVGRALSGKIYVQLPDQAIASVDEQLIGVLSDFVAKYGEEWPAKK